MTAADGNGSTFRGTGGGVLRRSGKPPSRILRAITGGLGGSEWNPFCGGSPGAEPVSAGEYRGVPADQNLRAVYPGARRDSGTFLEQRQEQSVPNGEETDGIPD